MRATRGPGRSKYGYRFQVFGYRVTDTFLLALALTVIVWMGVNRWMAPDAVSKPVYEAGPEAAAKPPPTELNIQPIRRIKAGEYSVKEFFDKFGDETVIVEGEVRHHPGFELGLRGVRELCSESLVQTSVYNASTTAWAGMSDKRLMPLGEYIDEYVAPPPPPPPPPCPFHIHSLSLSPFSTTEVRRPRDTRKRRPNDGLCWVAFH